MPSALWLVPLLIALQLRPPPPARGSIEGVVIRAFSPPGPGQYLSNVVVELKGENRFARTDGNGVFSFRNLAPGRYSLTVRREGFVLQEDAKSGQSSSAKNITVAAGQAIKDIVFSMVSAPTLSGRVYDPFGEPLAAALVQAHARLYTPYGPKVRAVKKGLTNDLGEFRLWWLNFGEYTLSATYGERALASALGAARLSANVTKPDDGYLTVFYGGGIQASDGQRVRLAPGSDTGSLNISFSDIPRFKIRGRISPNASGSSIAFAAQGSVLTESSNFIKPNTLGQFEIRGISPGEYVVVATAEGFSSDLIPVTVAGEDVENLTVPMVPVKNLSGFVSVDDGPNPDLSNMRVKLIRTSREVDQEIDAVTTGDGGFMLSNVGTGEYDILLEPLPPNFYIKSIVHVGRQLLGSPIRISDVFGQLQIFLGRAFAVVEGQVDKAGQPVAGAEVVLVPEVRLRRRPERYIVGFTDAMGSYQLSAVPPGRYTAYAFEELEPGAYYAFAYDSSVNLRFGSRGIPITIDDAGTTKLQLKAVAAAETAGGFQ